MRPLKFLFLLMLVAGTAVAQPSCCGVSGYSSPSMEEPWTVNTSASFLYWSVSQENMELGIVNNTDSFSTYVDGNVVNCDFSYNPGFVVGLGWTLPPNHWDVLFEYTWFRANNHVETSLQTGGLVVLAPFWEVPDPISPVYYFGSEDWKVSFDFVDAITARSYYIGEVLLVRPFFGARAAWIHQQIKAQYLDETTTLTSHNVYVNNGTHSWGVGPRFGLDMKWSLGKGTRLYANWGNDLLYTQYTKLRASQYATTRAGADVPGSAFIVRQGDLHHIRYHIDLDLGFGWEMILSKNGCCVDLSAAYTFQCFFHQNMFRKYIDDRFLSSIASGGNLDAHGLTATMRFNF